MTDHCTSGPVVASRREYAISFSLARRQEMNLTQAQQWRATESTVICGEAISKAVIRHRRSLHARTGIPHLTLEGHIRLSSTVRLAVKSFKPRVATDCQRYFACPKGRNDNFSDMRLGEIVLCQNCRARRLTCLLC